MERENAWKGYKNKKELDKVFKFAEGYRQFLSDCISKGNPQFDWQYIDYITRLRGH